MSNSEINIRRIQRGSRAWCRSELFHSNGMSQSMKITSRFVYRVLLGFGLRLPYPRPSKRASALQHSFPADLNELVRLERFQFHFQRTSNTFTKHLLRLFSHFATTLKTKLLFFFKKKGPTDFIAVSWNRLVQFYQSTHTSIRNVSLRSIDAIIFGGPRRKKTTTALETIAAHLIEDPHSLRSAPLSKLKPVSIARRRRRTASTVRTGISKISWHAATTISYMINVDEITKKMD